MHHSFCCLFNACCKADNLKTELREEPNQKIEGNWKFKVD